MYWIEIELARDQQSVRVSARASRGERVAPFELAGFNLGRLTGFANGVRRAVVQGRALPERILADARALHGALIHGALHEVYARLLEASRAQSPRAPLLVRVMSHELELQRIPWEVLCRADSGGDFLGCSAQVHVVRGVNSTEPHETREVRSAVRLLPISPLGEREKLAGLRAALHEPITAGALEWLEPIVGDETCSPRLFERLRASDRPHIIHWIGHGGADPQGNPRLMLPETEQGEPRWVTAETLAQELRAGLGADLRLVVLEACSGARPGAFASAAELLAREVADAVVAHLWPVQATVARRCAASFYRALTDARDSAGDVAASLQASRRTMIERGAEAFSPVLYLRGASSRLLDFSRRRIRPRAQVARDTSAALDPVLAELIQKPFSFVLGDIPDATPGVGSLQENLRKTLTRRGAQGADELGLDALAQHFSLRAGEPRLHRMFQRFVGGSHELQIPDFVRIIARQLRPGAHTTLLWLPLLESALAELHPERSIYVLQPAPLGTGERRLVMVRRAGAHDWDDDIYGETPDLERDFVLLRLYGGYSADSILSAPQLTEDDHIRGLLELREMFPRDWEAPFIGWVRTRPMLCVGVSVFEWRHRMLLRWLLDQRPPSRVSVAVVSPERGEKEVWDRGAGGLFGSGAVRAVAMDVEALGDAIQATARGEAR